MLKRDSVILALVLGGIVGFAFGRMAAPRIDNCPATLYAAVATATPSGTSISMRSLEEYCQQHPTLSRMSR